MSAEKFRPRRDWCLVLNDEREQVVAGGLLYLPNMETTPEKLSQGTGRVIRVGPGRSERVGIKTGDRVAYRGYLIHANPIDDGSCWPSGVRKHYCAICIDDIVGVIGEETSVGVFSSPASHAIKKEK